ncbi:MAG: serine hydrolase [Phaeovulum sp.]|uniref:serine hydrolase domain-containing protein n=1 Tax=Phaeovulum sp. TaxID=2934796 RepID=UPI002736C73B|nr:serine hydrolase [Phaeovulum sp.]MDP3862290.1 serine hydrolase [Phaeovulum sp.]
MRIVRIVIRVVLLVALVAGGLAVWKREEIARLLAVNSLFATNKIVANFSGMDRLFLTRPLEIGAGPVSQLPQGEAATLPPDVAAWVEARAVTALVVLKGGALVHESYYLGTRPEDLRISWSVAKSYLSALFGILHAEGMVPDLDAQVVDFAPSLKGSAYDGASVRDVLTMSAGAAFNEDYLDFNSDINRMGRVLALGGSMDGFAAGLRARAAPPGTRWHYVSIDTHVLGMVIAGASGRDPADLLAERLLAPMGLERRPYYVTDGEGTAFVLGGLNLTTRDYARFGLLFAQAGLWGERQLVPADWVAASTALQAPGGAAYGYQWWVPTDSAAHGGDYFARGIYGQYIYINPARAVVVAVNAADTRFEDVGVDEGNLAVLRSIAESL